MQAGARAQFESGPPSVPTACKAVEGGAIFPFRAVECVANALRHSHTTEPDFLRLLL